MEQHNTIDNTNNRTEASNIGEVDFEKYDKIQMEHEQTISQLKDEESRKSSEKIKQLTGELFNEDINLLRSETISPIEGANSMQILSENEALKGILKSLFEISEEKCKDGKQNEIILGNVTRERVDFILGDIINSGKEPSPQIRQYLYKLLSDNTPLYEEIMKRMGGPFILGANDRGDRGGNFDGGRGIHMGVDYNLPKGEPIKSIYDGIVVAKRSGTKITGDKTVIKHINDIYGEDGGKADNILIIEHNIGGKTFYSLYIHISDEENISVGSTVKKGQEIGKIAGYETNGHRQPHLHFTIMKTLDSRPMISGYLNKVTVDNDEKDEKYQKLYDEKYGKDMINPIEVYN